MALRWGIVSAGRISHDFVTAVTYVNKVKIVAIAARDEDKAEQFAKDHNIEKVFQTYQQMAESKDIDVAYIGALNHCHYELSKLFLENGKHVLCEKPLCLNAKQVASLIEVARKNKLFLMEAVWSRFLPSYLALEEILQSGNLGDILFVEANFGSIMSAKERIVRKDLGGGTLLDIGIYTIQFAQYIFKEEPKKISSSGSIGPGGTDESVTILLDYSGGRRAVLNVHGRVRFDNFASIVGTKDTVKLLHPFHCTEKLVTSDGVKEFLLPRPETPLNFVNSGGLAYQAEEVNRCIENGLIESPRMTHADSLLFAKIEDTVRAQIGVNFDADDQTF